MLPFVWGGSKFSIWFLCFNSKIQMFLKENPKGFLKTHLLPEAILSLNGLEL